MKPDCRSTAPGGHLAFALMFAAATLLPAAQPPSSPVPPPWSQIRRVKLSGGLRLFWDVGGGDLNFNRREALAHGFEIVDLLNTFSDYPGKQKQAIRVTQPDNPWQRPDYFTNIIQRNIAERGNQNAIFVHDIEFHFEEDAAKAWTNSAARAASGATTVEMFHEAYFREWAQWFAPPCRWAKERFPQTPIGLYGAQPFRRDYWGVAGKSAQQIDGTHRTDGELWRHIDPFVDFYIASVYFFYEDPGSLFYLASNVEENLERTRPFGNKPLYAYEWMRYHDSNKALRGQELSPWLVEAMAVVPYFCGARGVVLWGWEPKAQGQYYHRLPLFMESLARVADHSEKIGKAELIADEPAPKLWQEKRPLVRKLRVSADEWFVLVVNPWQAPDKTSAAKVPLGARAVELAMRGKHTDIYHCVAGSARRL
jgi:hypothetical protein